MFDPLRYLIPTTVKMRLFLQNLWIQEKVWEYQLENEDIETRQEIIAEIKELSTISVPRYIGGENPQLFCFCDASEKAYSTAIYLKTSCEGKAEVNLLFSKAEDVSTMTRVAGLLIGMRSLKFVSKELKLENAKITV